MLTFNGPSSILYLPDEAITSTFEVVMPSLDLSQINGVKPPKESSGNKDDGFLSKAWSAIKEVGSSLLTSRYYTPIVEAIQFRPLQEFKTENARVRDMYLTTPVDQEKPEDAKITIYCSSAFTAYYYLACWHNLIYDRDNECYNSAATYKRDIVVYYYGHDDLATAQFTLKGCFPKVFAELPLSYSDQKRINFTCTFNVDRIVQNDNVKTVALTKEYAAHIGSSLIQNVIPGMSGSAAAGAIREIFN